MKKIIWIGVIIVVIASANFLLKKNVSVDDESIKIGAVLPLSGDVADIGQEVNRGAELAVDIARQNGLNILYIPEDDVLNPVKSVSASQKLTSVDKVGSVFTLAGEEALPMVSVFNTAKIPLLVAWDSSARLKEASPYIYSIGFSNEATGEKMASYMRNELKLSKVAIVSLIDEVGDTMVSAFTKKFTSLGGAVVSTDKIQPTMTDFRSIILKIKSEKAEGVYLGLFPPGHSLFAVQKKQLGLNVPAGGPDITDSDIVQGGASIEGTYMTYIWSDNIDFLVEQYKKKFGKEPASALYATFGYDSVTVLIEASLKAKKDGISIKDALRQIKTDKTTTPVDMKGTNFSERVERIYRIENGKRVLMIK